MIPRPSARRARLGVLALVVAAVTLSSCTPPPTLTPQQSVEQIIGFVERARGHEFVTDPVVTFASEATFRQAVLDNVATMKPVVDAAEPIFHALGWLDTGRDLYQTYQVAFGGAVVGFYDPVTKVLFVRGTSVTPYRREVIAHELTHALDDQLFGLDESFDDGLLGERTFASLVAIEGSASRVQQSYVSSMSAVEQLQDLAEQLNLGSDPALLSVPLALLSFMQAPYLRGATFVGQVAAAVGGATAGLDAPLSRYPSTAEQAFDTAKYLIDEPAVAVTTPPIEPGGTAVGSGTWGQFLLTALIRSGLALDSVDPATLGWAGDAYVTWAAGSQSCFRLDVVMDTPTQAASLRSALGTWLSTRPGASALDLGAAMTRITSCS